MSKPHRILATAFIAALVAAAPASASPLKVHVAPTDSLVLKTCGGPNEIVECRPPVD